MPWQILVVISLLTYSFAVIVSRSILKSVSVNPVAFTLAYQFITGSFVLIWFLIKGASVGDIKTVYPQVIIGIMVWSAVNIVSNYALQKTEASVFTVILSLRNLVGILLSVFLLKEAISSTQTVGAILLLSSCILVSSRKTKIHFGLGEQLSLLAAFLFGIGYVVDRFVLKQAGIEFYLWLAYWGPALITSIFYRKEVSNAVKLMVGVKKWDILLLCILYFIASVTFFTALKIAPTTTQVISVNLTSVVVIVFLAAIFLKERDEILKKIFASIIAFIGLLLVV